MFCQYSRGGEKESAGEVAESEREKERQTDENDKTQPKGTYYLQIFITQITGSKLFCRKSKK